MSLLFLKSFLRYKISSPLPPFCLFKYQGCQQRRCGLTFIAFSGRHFYWFAAVGFSLCAVDLATIGKNIFFKKRAKIVVRIFAYLLIFRRALDFELYVADYVHLLPGYPSNGSVSRAVAFYVQQPPGLFTGNNSVLPSNTLVDIVVLYKSELEGAIGATISSVKAVFTPTRTTTTTTRKPIEESENNNWKWIVIGVIVGVLFIILIIAFVIWR